MLNSQTSNTVYEIVSDMATRQDALEEKLTTLEEKLQTIQVSLKFAAVMRLKNF